MNSTQEILLNNSINKKSTNENASLNVNISGNKKLLPEDGINGTVDAYKTYIDERTKSNKFRLVVNVNPICTNVLFNPFTEIVRNEGRMGYTECLNYVEGGMPTENAHSIIKGTFEESTFTWTQREAIRDTQLSNEVCGFEYHCGVDIFNNHTLRQRNAASINYDKINSEKKLGSLALAYGNIANLSYANVFVNEAYKNEQTEEHAHVYVDDNFNTIDDYMRDKEGVIISDHIPLVRPLRIIDGVPNYRQNRRMYVLPLHVYQNYNTKTFEESKEENLKDKNGWYGFDNQMTLGRINITTNYGPVEINKTINTHEYGDFIDMYPGRKLYSFTPIYNEHMRRLEKNWNYCITYPSSSVTENANGEEFPFFYKDSSGKTALRVYMFDEGTIDDDGVKVLTIYTVCQHGLIVGDTINIYKNDDLFYKSVFVKNVIDKYIFQVVKDTANMSEEWLELDDRGNGVWHHTDGNYYPVCESNRCNVDPNAQNVYFRRVVNGVECEYYVRMFSRLPNFKFRDEEVNDYTLYDDEFNSKKVEAGGLPLLKEFSNPGDSRSEFESHCAKLGFAETSYGDDTTEILFTDDIDTSYIRDNLGRPLSDIYLTVVKNNRGYKDWYGIGCEIHTSDYIDIDKGLRYNRVEYSHCFGKVNSSFLLSDYYREYYKAVESYELLLDVRDITSNRIGTLLKETESDEYIDDIDFNTDFDYYGDICCYSPVDCDEQVIQNAMHRFNTVQRELGIIEENVASAKYFNNGVLEVDEIFDDEYTLPYGMSNAGDPYNRFARGCQNKIEEGGRRRQGCLYHTVNRKYNDMTSFKEGYYYQPHYRISVKTISNKLSSDKAIQYEIFEFVDTNTKNNEDREIFEITTTDTNYFSINEKMVMYKRSTNEYFYVTLLIPIDFDKFSCVIAGENGNHLNITDLLHGTEVVKGTWDDDDSFTKSEEGTDYAVKTGDLYIKPNDYILENIDDYIIIKKREKTPDYAKLIKDGSCRYCWREVVSNGIENDKNVFPFTNGAFYINRRINFYLRRQDPHKEYLGRVETYDYVPDGEDIRNYPNLNFYEDDNYDINEIEEC